MNHVTYGKCELKVEREPLLDTAMVWYSKKLWGDESSLSVETSDVHSAVSLSGLHTYGNCELKVEREPLLDTAMVWYSKKLWGDESSLSVEASDVHSAVSLSGLHKKEEEGWALKPTKKSKAFSEKQKMFLEEKFLVVESTGGRLDPVTVARQMKTTRGAEGNDSSHAKKFYLLRIFKDSFPGGLNAEFQFKRSIKIVKMLRTKTRCTSCETVC